MQYRIRVRDQNWETLETIDIEAATPYLALAHMLCWHNEMIDLYWPKQTSASDLTFVRTGLVPMSGGQVIDHYGYG